MRAADRGDFEALICLMVDMARATYRHSTELAPLLFIVRQDDSGKDGVAIFPIDQLQSDERPKDALAWFMQAAVTLPETLLVGHLTEAWMVRGKTKETYGDLRPSEHPDRVEALLFNLLSEDCQALKICELHREGDLTTFDEGAELRFNEKNGISLSGRFVRAQPALN